MFQKAICSLGDEDLDDKVFTDLETFICHLYGVGVTKSIKERKVNEVRFTLFNRQYKMNDVSEAIKKKMRSFDASSLPPSHSELFQHMLGAWYITKIWLNSHKQSPSDFLPENHGWELTEENSFTFKWFEGL